MTNNPNLTAALEAAKNAGVTEVDWKHEPHPQAQPQPHYQPPQQTYTPPQRQYPQYQPRPPERHDGAGAVIGGFLGGLAGAGVSRFIPRGIPIPGYPAPGYGGGVSCNPQELEQLHARDQEIDRQQQIANLQADQARQQNPYANYGNSYQSQALQNARNANQRREQAIQDQCQIDSLRGAPSGGAPQGYAPQQVPYGAPYPAPQPYAGGYDWVPDNTGVYTLPTQEGVFIATPMNNGQFGIALQGRDGRRTEFHGSELFQHIPQQAVQQLHERYNRDHGRRGEIEGESQHVADAGKPLQTPNMPSKGPQQLS